MKKNRPRLRLLLGKVSLGSDGQQRSRKLFQAGISALASRGLGMVVNVVSMPLAISYVGNENYGIWVTIGTLIAWLEMADFGLSNGMINFLTAAATDRQSAIARRLVATTWWLLIMIACGVGLLWVMTWRWLDWFWVFQTRSDVGAAMAIAIGLCLLNFPLRLVSNILSAYQENQLANYWRAAGNLASLLVLLVLTKTAGNLVNLVVAMAGTTLVINAVSAFWLFRFHRPELQPSWHVIDRSTVQQILRSGGAFFLLQVVALLLFQTDSLIITQMIGTAAVTPYSIAWRIFAYTNIVQTLIQPALWPAYTQAYHRGDQAWMRRTFRSNLFIALISTGFFVVILLLGGQYLIASWTGIQLPISLMLWMGAWSLVNVAMNVMGCLLNATGHIHSQSLYGALAAIVNLGLSILWAPIFSLTGVIAATVVAYLLCNTIPVCWQVQQVLQKKP